MLELNNLRDKFRATKNRKRVGRGYSGDRPGHGGKGQTARTGVALGNFQGGQLPIERRLPKQRSFYTPEKMSTVSLERVQDLINLKRLKASDIKKEDLVKLKVVQGGKKYKLVGVCDISINIESYAISNGANDSIKQNKGSVNLIK